MKSPFGFLTAPFRSAVLSRRLRAPFRSAVLLRRFVAPFGSAFLFFAPCAAHAQAVAKVEDRPIAFVVDKKLAKAGKAVWTARGCMGCHTIGKGRLAAPDLNGLFDRRAQAWVRSWLQDPDAMLATDSTAKALLAEYRIEMPNFKLSADEITALINYIASESKMRK